MTPTRAAIRDAAAAIHHGRLVGMPTETVYGLACHALDDRAVARVFEAKARPAFDPLIVHCSGDAQARRFAATWPDVAQCLAEALWPGPLTLVLPKRVDGDRPVGDLVTSGLPTVALRVPNHRIALALIGAAGVPLAAPSANRFGRISPTRAEHVADELGDRDDLAVVLDGGPCRTGVESTVVSCVDASDVTVLRLGGVSLESLGEVLGGLPRVATREDGNDDAARGRVSPGMLARHYAPTTPLRLVDALDTDGAASAAAEPVGVLAFSSVPPALRRVPHEVLSATGDPLEAAANLFAALRRLDASGVSAIVAERAPDAGLGRAINDRLRRAAEA